jgi:cytochrome b subunit of formate dehydrogenase
MLGFGWGLVYAYAIKPLTTEGPLRLQALSNLSPSDALWWKHLIALAFDVLIVLIAAAGTLYVLGNFYLEAPEAGKWRLYYKRSLASRDVRLPRLTAWQRFQHIWVMITFIICAVTGFAAMAGYGDRVALLTIHVYSGIAMGIVALLHFGYYTAQLLLAKARGENLREKFPMLEIYSKRFIKNAVRVMLGKKPEPMGKYDVEQLFEYWGVYWGMAVLGIPGVIMLLAGNQVLDGIFWVTHTKEAVLAVTFILMVHLSYSHFRPKIFPMDPTFLTGWMPLRRAKEEHPRWAEKAAKEEATGQA